MARKWALGYYSVHSDSEITDEKALEWAIARTGSLDFLKREYAGLCFEIGGIQTFKKWKQLNLRLTKFSPGPWAPEATSYGFRSSGVIWQQDPNGSGDQLLSSNHKVIARVEYRYNANEDWLGATGPEYEANCHLIGAAPDLFKALQKAQETLCEHLCWSGHSRGCKARTEALDKAQGIVKPQS